MFYRSRSRCNGVGAEIQQIPNSGMVWTHLNNIYTYSIPELKSIRDPSLTQVPPLCGWNGNGAKSRRDLAYGGKGSGMVGLGSIEL